MKTNKKGFTLIELLAVITIMGILMLVAIPAIARTIENTRRDSFKNTALQYIETVRTSLIAGELACTDADGDGSAAGTYYFIVSTNTLTDHTYSPSQTQDLMESGGKSSWGNKDVKGAIVWVRTADSHSGFTNTFYAYLIDSANHGIDAITQENAINRTAVKTAVNANSTYSTKLNSLANLKTALQNNKGSISANFSGSTAPLAIECHLAQ